VSPSLNASTLDQYFKNRLVSLNKSLIEHKSDLKNDKLKLESFVNSQILPLWSSTSTLKALLGSKVWKALSVNHQKELIEVFNQTLHRYVSEGMKFYDNQQFSFVSTKLSKKGSRGYLTILIEPEILPSINVTFRMAKINADWKLYDVLIAGVSYVKMKKLEFRRLYAEKGIEAVIKLLKNKNAAQQNKNNKDKK